MTNTQSEPMVIITCTSDHNVAVPARYTSGIAECPACGDSADISHAYVNVGWCTECGGVDGDHSDECTHG